LLLPAAAEPTSLRLSPLGPPVLVADEVPNGPSVAPASGSFEPRTMPILQPSVRNLEGYLEQIERAAILRALEETRYNKTAAAEKLGISFRALRYRLKKLGLD